MAGRKRTVDEIDYVQLNSLSSVVLYDTATKKSRKGPFYEAERVIERRKAHFVRFPDYLFTCDRSIKLRSFSSEFVVSY